jgi:hypothetical protein
MLYHINFISEILLSHIASKATVQVPSLQISTPQNVARAAHLLSAWGNWRRDVILILGFAAATGQFHLGVGAVGSSAKSLFHQLDDQEATLQSHPR